MPLISPPDLSAKVSVTAAVFMMLADFGTSFIFIEHYSLASIHPRVFGSEHYCLGLGLFNSLLAGIVGVWYKLCVEDKGIDCSCFIAGTNLAPFPQSGAGSLLQP
jgi:hypothetical protein